MQQKNPDGTVVEVIGAATDGGMKISAGCRSSEARRHWGESYAGSGDAADPVLALLLRARERFVAGYNLMPALAGAGGSREEEAAAITALHREIPRFWRWWLDCGSSHDTLLTYWSSQPERAARKTALRLFDRAIARREAGQ